jgi:ATP-dependent protease ClpP protease subunit
MTIARAVAEADGYEDGAWKKQVILVRGSIHNPEKMIVDLRAIIRGQAPDIEIESGDIIYVRERPTRLLEEAVDEAIFTFVQTATAEAINEEVSTTIDAGQ